MLFYGSEMSAGIFILPFCRVASNPQTYLFYNENFNPDLTNYQKKITFKAVDFYWSKSIQSFLPEVFMVGNAAALDG